MVSATLGSSMYTGWKRRSRAESFSILLDVLAVLVGRGGADDLDLAARQGRLEDGGRVDGALRRARTDDGVDLVDEQDGVAGGLDLVDDLLQALLELAAILGASHQGRHVERPDLLATQDVGHIAPGNQLRQALDHGGLAHARVAQDERVVLLAARKHLHDALDLAVAADDRVELAVGGKLGEVLAVAFEHGVVVVDATTRDGAHRARVEDALGCHGTLALGGAAVAFDQLAYGVANGVARNTHARESRHGATVALGHNAQQQMLGGNVGLAVRHGLAIGILEHALGARRERNVAAGDRLVDLGRNLAHGGDGLLIGNVELCQRLSRNALALLDEGKQQMLGANVHLAEAARLFLCKAHDLACLVGELLKHAGKTPPHR